jgi:hypothetical protein
LAGLVRQPGTIHTQEHALSIKKLKATIAICCDLAQAAFPFSSFFSKNQADDQRSRSFNSSFLVAAQFF